MASEEFKFNWKIPIDNCKRQENVIESPNFTTVYRGHKLQWTLSLLNNVHNKVIQLCLNPVNMDNVVFKKNPIVSTIIHGFNDLKSAGPFENRTYRVGHLKIFYFTPFKTSLGVLSANFTKPIDITFCFVIDMESSLKATGIKSCSSKPIVPHGQSNGVTQPNERPKTGLRWKAPIYQDNPEKSLVLQSFNHMLVTEKYCDVTIQCDGHRFGAHRAILASRSLIFGQLLSPATTTDNNGIIVLNFDDLYDLKTDATTMADMLQYIYTGTAPNIGKTVQSLQGAASKFGLAELKTRCNELICQQVTIDSVINAYMLMKDVDEMDPLKQKVIRFIRGNIKQLMENPGFEEAMKSNCDLMYNVFKQCILIDK